MGKFKAHIYFTIVFVLLAVFVCGDKYPDEVVRFSIAFVFLLANIFIALFQFFK